MTILEELKVEHEIWTFFLSKTGDSYIVSGEEATSLHEVLGKAIVHIEILREAERNGYILKKGLEDERERHLANISELEGLLHRSEQKPNGDVEISEPSHDASYTGRLNEIALIIERVDNRLITQKEISKIYTLATGD